MNGAMMQKLQRIQRELKEGQERIENSEYEGNSTGVTMVLQGNKTVLQITIADEMLEDKEMLQDSLIVAFNSACEKIDKDLSDLQAKFIPGGMGGMF